MKNIIFLEPIFKTKIWGGNKLREKYYNTIKKDNVGEAWLISAHNNGDSVITNGEYKGKTLSWLWENNRKFFGNVNGEEFPLLVKIIDASDDLSIQVHPDDLYAKKYENELGKTECWYILDCNDDTELVMGHTAKSKDEMLNLINNNEWDNLLIKKDIKKGDFFYIEPGTIHAICKNTTILEIQQSSDVTYRFYDYNRLQDGKPRELHLDKAIEVVNFPHKDYFVDKTVTDNIETLIEEKYFSVHKLSIKEKQTFSHDKPFLLFTVTKGNGYLDEHNIKVGDSFILSENYNEYTISGNLEIIISHI